MRKVLILRYDYRDNYTLGNCYIIKENGTMEYIGVTLERGWKENARNISCVPEGIYDLELEYSPRFERELWELKNVPDRSECKFHAANYWQQLNGCISLGEKHIDINYDGDIDVTKSLKSMNLFHNVMRGKKSMLIIRNITV